MPNSTIRLFENLWYKLEYDKIKTCRENVKKREKRKACEEKTKEEVVLSKPPPGVTI